MTIVSVKVGSRKENWIAEAEECLYEAGAYDRENAKLANEMAVMIFESYIEYKNDDKVSNIYLYTPEEAVQEELSYW